MLAVESATVTYGPIVAVDGASFAVEDGEVVAILGPSGSGKSTLLRVIAGLEPASGGTVRWDGELLDGVPPNRRAFGLMFQDPTLFPHRDVLANVAFGLRMQRRDPSEVDARARGALALVGLTGHEHRRVHQLSGGEQHRVALARALAPEPRLLMLDEPLGSLDRALRERLLTDLHDLLGRLHQTTIVVTHDHDEAFGLADRVAVMRAGRIEQVGPPADVWRHPANGFVAGFLGWNVTTAFGRGTVAVRPDAVRLVSSGGIAGMIEGTTFRRDGSLVRVEVGGDRLVVAVATGAPIPTAGATVHLELDEDGVVALDPS